MAIYSALLASLVSALCLFASAYIMSSLVFFTKDIRRCSERFPDASELAGLEAGAPGRCIWQQLKLHGSGLAAHRARLAGGLGCCGLAQRLWRRRWIAFLPAPRRRYWRRQLLLGNLPSVTFGDSVDLGIEQVSLPCGLQTFTFGDASA